MTMLRGPELESLWTELAHAVEQGRPLPPVVRDLAQTSGGRRGRALRALADSMRAGRSLSQAVAASQKFFPHSSAPALQAGEKSGNLAEALRSLADTARLDYGFRGSILHAIAYPLFVALIASAATLFAHLYLKPQFIGFWMDLHIEDLSAEASCLLTFLQWEAVIVCFVPALVLIVLYVFPAKLLPMRRLMDALRLRIPLVGKLLSKLLLARWCRTFGCLVRAGVQEAEAVELAGRSTGNRAVQRVSGTVAAELTKGTRLADAMGCHRFFLRPLVWMVGAAEERGGHADVWPIAERSIRRQANDAAPVVDIVLRIIFAVLALQIVGMTLRAFISPLMLLMEQMGA